MSLRAVVPLSLKLSLAYKPFHLNAPRYFSLNSVCSMCFGLAETPKRGKRFTEFENRFAHQVLEKTPAYRDTVIKARLRETPGPDTSVSFNVTEIVKTTEWASLSPSEALEQFCLLSSALPPDIDLTHESFNVMVSSLVKNMRVLTDDELEKGMRFLSLWPPVESCKAHNFYSLWKAFDQACLDRWKLWEAPKVLKFIDLWYNLYLTRQSNFVFRSMIRYGTKPRR